MLPRSKTSLILALAVSIAASAHSQAPPSSPPASPKPSAIVQSALSDVQTTTVSLNISRWKAPGSTRAAAQENVDSIQRDLSSTLPGLLAQADAAPDSVVQSFAVYRNVDALYDVLLRVSEVANYGAPPEEADAVSAALSKLEAARSQLGDAILGVSQRHETQLVDLEKAIQAAKAAPPSKPKEEVVVDDGPAKPQHHYRRKTVKKPVTQPAPQKPAAASTQ